MSNSISNFTFSCLTDINSTSLSNFGWLVDNPSDSGFDKAGNGYTISVIATLLFLLAVPWNLLVIAAIIIIKKKLYTQPIIMLMLNLTITNLLVALLVMPFNIIAGFKGEYAFGKTDQVRCQVCKYTGILNVILPWVSLHNLSLMAVDRFIYLKKPLKYNCIVTAKRTLATLIAIWILCIILGIFPLFGFGEIRFLYPMATCFPSVRGSTHIAPNYCYLILLSFESVIPIITLIVLYTWVFCLVRSNLSMRIRRSLNLASTQKTKEQVIIAEKYSKAQIRLVWLFGAVIAGNIFTWIPALVVTIVATSMDIPTLTYTISYLLYLSQTVIHPILEACLIKDISQMASRCFNVLKIKPTSKSSKQLNITSAGSKTIELAGV